MKKPLFIHINRTGGTSIKKALGLGAPYHETYAEAIIRLGDTLLEYWPFSVVRNPYDRVASQYQHRMRVDYRGFRSHGLSFESFVRKVYLEEDPTIYMGRDRRFARPSAWWLRVNMSEFDYYNYPPYIYLFRSLPDIGKEIEKHTGIRVEIPHLNSSTRESSIVSHTPFTRRVIREAFQLDFEAFPGSWQL